MKKETSMRIIWILSLLAMGVAGCSTRDVNPARARAGTGYVDFRAGGTSGLSWQVSVFDKPRGDFRPIFSKFPPPAGGVLRLGFPPGHYRLRITFLNRPVLGPGDLEVDVHNGMITPVEVVLTPEGSTLIERKEHRPGPTLKGHYGRVTKRTSQESSLFRITSKASPPIPYQPKEQPIHAP